MTKQYKGIEIKDVAKGKADILSDFSIIESVLNQR